MVLDSSGAEAVCEVPTVALPKTVWRAVCSSVHAVHGLGDVARCERSEGSAVARARGRMYVFGIQTPVNLGLLSKLRYSTGSTERDYAVASDPTVVAFGEHMEEVPAASCIFVIV